MAKEQKEPVENIPISAQEIRNFVDRIVRLEEEKKATADSIKDIYTEVDSKGYSKKALRIIVKREMETADQRDAREATETALELMLAALGDYVSTPLGDAAKRSVQ